MLLSETLERSCREIFGSLELRKAARSNAIHSLLRFLRMANQPIERPEQFTIEARSHDEKISILERIVGGSDKAQE